MWFIYMHFKLRTQTSGCTGGKVRVEQTETHIHSQSVHRSVLSPFMIGLEYDKGLVCLLLNHSEAFSVRNVSFFSSNDNNFSSTVQKISSICVGSTVPREHRLWSLYLGLGCFYSKGPLETCFFLNHSV